MLYLWDNIEKGLDKLLPKDLGGPVTYLIFAGVFYKTAEFLSYLIG